MKIDIELIRKLHKEISIDVMILVQKIEEIDNSYGNGYVQSAIVAKICAELYNTPKKDTVSHDIMEVVFNSKEKK